MEGLLDLSSSCVHPGLGWRWIRFVGHLVLDSVLRVRSDSVGALEGNRTKMGVTRRTSAHAPRSEAYLVSSCCLRDVFCKAKAVRIEELASLEGMARSDVK